MSVFVARICMFSKFSSFKKTKKTKKTPATSSYMSAVCKKIQKCKFNQISWHTLFIDIDIYDYKYLSI
jgi:hypothetical protein